MSCLVKVKDRKVKEKLICNSCFFIFSFQSHLLQSQFKSFSQFAKTFNEDKFSFDELNRSDYVFMRWKVRSLEFDYHDNLKKSGNGDIMRFQLQLSLRSMYMLEK